MDPVPKSNNLKEQVRTFWNQGSCDTQIAQSSKFSKDYFEEIETYRYFDQPFIHSFAQFSRYRGKRILEVGFGAGSDFTQWLRSGARANGIDLTPEALANLTHRISVYGLPQPESIQVGDAEKLPFDSNQFDLGYSFGVLHHSPNTELAVRELVRVIRPGGELKVMLYNRRSIYAISQWVKHALARGRPWKSVAWAVWNHVESVGTKAYTRAELRRILGNLPLSSARVETFITSADYLSASAFPPLNWLYRFCIWAAGDHPAWRVEDFKSGELRYVRSHSHEERGDLSSKYLPKDEQRRSTETADATSEALRAFAERPGIEFYGNPLGWFHCITARKQG